MMIKSGYKDTIAAVATPPGRGAIGMIRVSGPDAIQKVNRVFRGKDLEKQKTHTIHFGKIMQGEEVVDEVLVSVFRAPASYTGENMAEVSCHGSPYVLKRVLEVFSGEGIRNAEAGEFTLRAFLNKKLDLSQAEAVIDIIDSENKMSHQVAMKQMRGGFSEKIRQLRQRLVDLISLFELELDFGEEDVEFATHDQLQEILKEVETETRQLVDSFKLGNVIKKGVSVVIAGRPNAGKSTLLNTLLQEERAIISDIPGTTRDFIEDVLTINGVDFRFTDTAGLTDSEDEIEKIGIARTLEKLGKADIVIYLFDVSRNKPEKLIGVDAELNTPSPVIFVANKKDKLNAEELKEYRNKLSEIDHDVLFVSSKMNDNIDKLKELLIRQIDLEKFSGDYSIVSNARHYEILSGILDSISEVEQGIREGLSKDFIAIDVRSIISQMSEITGDITNDEILGNIFSRFCIGK